MRRVAVVVILIFGLQVLAVAPPRDDGREQRAANLRKLMIAMHNYHADYQKLPTAIVFSKDNKPLLSWRVTLLKYLGQEELLGRFKLNEPWDSANNKKLLEEM